VVLNKGSLMDVVSPGEKTDADGHVIGWNDFGTATNWDLNRQNVQVWAHCTSDPTQAY
jgi:hypothetical protein